MSGSDYSMFPDFKDNESIEIKMLLEAVFLKYGYDFRDYGKAHLRRRIKNFMELYDITNISYLQHAILEDPEIFHALLLKLSVNVTEMFRDPGFYISVRNNVIPHLNTYPYIKVWHAGCSTGEEVYSMAILLKEEALLERSQVYATDFNQIVLKKATEGIYPVENVKDYTRNYNEAGGKSSFSDYYTANYQYALLSKELKKKIVFSDHNLVTDGVFGEMNLIVCRNVLIYFNRELQNRVLELFYESLLPGGYLCLGSKESLLLTDYADSYEQIDLKQKIFKKPMF